MIVYYFRAINFAKNIKWLLSHDKDVLKNKNLRNRYLGNRCFVLGNGPSLNIYDLSVLKHEKVFVVNDFVRSNKVRIVNPDFYVLADPRYFDMVDDNEQDEKFRQEISSLSTICSGINLFVPLEAKASIKRYRWDDLLSINYFKAGLFFYPKYSKRIDFSKRVPSMQAVVQYAIILAIYMGFR